MGPYCLSRFRRVSTENQYNRHPLFLGQFGELFMKPVGGMMVRLGRPGVFRLVFKGKGRFTRVLGSAFSCKILDSIDDDTIELCGK